MTGTGLTFPELAMPRSIALLTLVCTVFCISWRAGAEPSSLPTPPSTAPADIAEEVDRLIREQLQQAGVSPTGPCGDEDFLRRVSLDLAGRIPTPQDVTLFGLTPSLSKRADRIDRLLQSDDFARSSASYWREVIFSRATDARARFAQPVFEEWLIEQLQSSAGWDRITTELLTATGNTGEDGSTAFIFAHGGDPVEIAGEVSRIFLGIQIQCANCHDHPYDQWKREDFHELAAFFPRIRLRRDGDGQRPTFYVESADNQRDRRAQFFDPAQLFRFLDRNRDEVLTRAEAQQSRQFQQRFARLVEIADKDGDGALSREEFDQIPRPQPQPGQGTSEYFMPDLENPTEPGTRTEPVFFVDDRKVPFGTRDLDRRAALAQSLTGSSNPWFARAFVNRIWAAMLGEGFYSPVDDMGPERDARFAEALDLLAAGFVANDYDIRWVYRTIALTDAYQRDAATAAPNSQTVGFAAASLTRLRGDQIYNAVTQVLGGDASGAASDRVGRPMTMRGRGRDFGRFAFGQLFNYDPSTPQGDLTGNIPQALFMMNSPMLSAGINARGNTALRRILTQFEEDRAALSELYLRVLTREPTVEEIDICLEYVTETADRNRAFEDIMWSLLNSTEFLTKR
jgi:hypothetical protein